MIVRDPNEVRAALETPPAAAAGADAKRGEVLANITSSYFFLRRGLAFLALAFPFALWALAGIHNSLSAYYHCSRDGCGAGAGAARDVFVGVLWATGTFLFFYRAIPGRRTGLSTWPGSRHCASPSSRPTLRGSKAEA